MRRELGPAKTTPKPTKDETIKEFVDLVDMLQLGFVGILRPPYTNSERDDLYLLAASKVNETDEQGRITPELERYGVLYSY